MQHRASFKNKARSNAVAHHSDTKRNIPRGISFAITHLHSTYSINTRAEQTSTEGEKSHLFYMDGLKELGRNENNLENSIKIVKAITEDINMNFGLEKCARICI